MCTLDDFKTTTNDYHFTDGEYVVWSEKAHNIKPGDIIHLTNSESDYDCVYGCFMNDLRKCAKVKVEILNEEQGKFVYAAAKVLEVIEVGY